MPSELATYRDLLTYEITGSLTSPRDCNLEVLQLIDVEQTLTYVDEVRGPAFLSLARTMLMVVFAIL